MELSATTDVKELGPAWQQIVGKRKLNYAILAEMGIGDTTVAMLVFDQLKDICEVGEGEALRPYHQLYLGSDPEEATKIFLDRCSVLRQEDRYEDECDDEN